LIFLFFIIYLIFKLTLNIKRLLTFVSLLKFVGVAQIILKFISIIYKFLSIVNLIIWINLSFHQMITGLISFNIINGLNILINLFIKSIFFIFIYLMNILIIWIVKWLACKGFIILINNSILLVSCIDPFYILIIFILYLIILFRQKKFEIFIFLFLKLNFFNILHYFLIQLIQIFIFSGVILQFIFIIRFYIIPKIVIAIFICKYFRLIC
jgi:hypothetical protein